jgi:hypothetical protein
LERRDSEGKDNQMAEEDSYMTEEIDDMVLLEQYKASGQLPLFWQLIARQFVCAANISVRNVRTTIFSQRKNQTTITYGNLTVLSGYCTARLWRIF